MTVVAASALALVVGCGGDGGAGDATGSTPAAPRSPAERLHGELAAAVDYDFDLAVFVIDGSGTSMTGATGRRYAFDSITKTVTGLILASLIEDGIVHEHTALGDLLDAGRNGDVTLVELASHAAGLPRLAPNADDWPGFDQSNPYAGYTAEMAEHALRTVERDPPGDYSNFGFQVLGLALERATGTSLAELARTRVFEPAGMAGASIPAAPGTLGPGLARGREVPVWDSQLGGAGAVIGTIADLARYAEAMLDPPPALAAPVARAVMPRTHQAAGDAGLGWITTRGLTWHNGGSAGYSALVVIDLSARRAAGYLAASGDLRGEDTVFDFVSDGG